MAEGGGSEERSREDLTEEASPYRLEEFRKKGQVAQSKEVAGVAALIAAAVTLYAMSPTMGSQLAEFMREVFRTDLSARADLGSVKILGQYLMKSLKLMALIALPVCGAGFILGAVGNFAQIGSIFSFDPITPDFDKINPMNGLKRLISMNQAIEGLKLTIKMIIIGFVAYGLVKSQIIQSPQKIILEPGALLQAYGEAARVMFLSLIGILVLFAAVDYGLQKWEFSKNVRMTKQEAKQEFKEREGDPQIKARIRAVAREMARKRMMQAVKKADVIITNPTHIAIALVYDKEKMAAPKVVAKGADFVAQKIKKIAAEAGVPMVENVPLARTLYKTVKVGQGIPRALYQAVAEVLAYVYRLKQRRF